MLSDSVKKTQKNQQSETSMKLKTILLGFVINKRKKKWLIHLII